MDFVLSVTLSGVANGMIFAAVALGLVFIYRATRIVHFAYGAMGMITTFIAFSVLSAGLDYWVAFALSLSIGLALGAAVERLLIRPVQGRPEINPVIVTIGLLVVLEGIAGAVWGNASRGFEPAFSQSGLVIGGARIAFSSFDLFIVAAVLALMLVTWLLFRATELGLRMRASAFAPETARLLGVRVGRLMTLGWAVASLIGSLAGLLVAPTTSFSPYFMDLPFVFGFTAAVIGGLDSPPGALVGGLVTGLAIAYVGGYLGSSLEPLGALALLMVALMARPRGIFAAAEGRRV
jgi:branched-chain amino acid transport system permease protein